MKRLRLPRKKKKELKKYPTAYAFWVMAQKGRIASIAGAAFLDQIRLGQ